MAGKLRGPVLSSTTIQSTIMVLFMLYFMLFVLFPATTHASSVAGQETLVGVVGRDFVMLGADSSKSQSIALTSSNLDKIAVLVDPLLLSDETPLSRQQTIVAAAAGDAADADRLIGLLTAYAAIEEFEASVGCDVEFIDLKNDESPGFVSPPGLSVTQVAHLARGQIAESMRTRGHYKVCLLVAGMELLNQNDNEQWTTDPADEGRDPLFVSKQVQLQVKNALQRREAPQNQSLQQKPKDKQEDGAPSSALEPRLYWLDEYGSVQKLKYGAHGFGSNFCLSILDRGYKPNLTKKEAQELIENCFEQLRIRYVINSPQPPCIKCVDAHGCELMTISEKTLL